MVRLFLVTWLVGAFGAVAGSIIGGAFGEHPLFIGALVGGAIASALSVRFAEYHGWIPRANRTRVIVGAVVGFCVAAIIATRTLSSPIGPIHF